MTYSNKAAAKLAERARLEGLRQRRLMLLARDQHHAAPNSSQMVPRLRMIVSPWFNDADGVRTRLVRAE